jgi:V/A-type H+-transporting ATPase subunit K
MREKPEMFGRMLIRVLLPGTQGFYGFIAAVLMMQRTGLLTGQAMDLSPMKAVALFGVGSACGLVQLISAIQQGQASAAGISLVGRRPDSAGRALLSDTFSKTAALRSMPTPNAAW